MRMSLSEQSSLIQILLRWGSVRWVKIAGISLAIILFQLVYILFRFRHVNELVPFFYTMPWGDMQLAPKNYLYFFPAITLVVLIISLFFYKKSKEYYWPYAGDILLVTPLLVGIILTLSTMTIIYKASSPFEPLFSEHFLSLIWPFATALVLTIIFSPKFIDYFKRKNIVTNPSIHKHPSMILKQPSARGGGLVFTIFFILTCFYFVGFSAQANAIYIGTALLALMGFIDDYQNTNPRSKLKVFENPIIRLGSLFLLVMVPIYMGIRINAINNPFNGTLNLEHFTFALNGNIVPYVAILVTAIWIVWVLNVLSWSNGVDGQYGGIVGIAGIVIAILALRFTPIEPAYLNAAKIAVAASGAAFGITYFNWYPSKIMWGFGAMSAGLVIAATSIIIGGKVATSVLIILIPFLDGTVIVLRRLIQGKNPFKGDRGHLHHLLMDRGWGVRRISVFYWLTTIVMGVAGILSAGKDNALLTLTVSGIIGFIIALLHFSAMRRNKMKLAETLTVSNTQTQD